LQTQEHFHKNIKILFSVSTPTVGQVCSGVFQRLPDMQDHNSLNAEAHMKIQLSSQTLQFAKMQNTTTFSPNVFVLENIVVCNLKLHLG
jgi:hypothetical protein